MAEVFDFVERVDAADDRPLADAAVRAVGQPPVIKPPRPIAEGLRLDQIETPLDKAHISGKPVDARR